MKKVKSQTDDKEITYKDCIWYMKDIDRCKMPGAEERYMKCVSKRDGKMYDFCVWITNFKKSVHSLDEDKPKEVQLELFNTDDPFDFGSPPELAPDNYMESLFEKAHETLKK